MNISQRRYIIICALFVISMIGCIPPANTNIRFIINSKEDRNSAGYTLHLNIRLKIKTDEGYWNIYPDSIRVLFENKPMLQLPYKGPWYSNPLIPKKSYKFDLSFDCRPWLELSEYDSTKTLEGAKLKVILNHFLYFNGEPVYIDTLNALELMARLHLHALIKK